MSQAVADFDADVLEEIIGTKILQGPEDARQRNVSFTIEVVTLLAEAERPDPRFLSPEESTRRNVGFIIF